MGWESSWRDVVDRGPRVVHGGGQEAMGKGRVANSRHCDRGPNRISRHSGSHRGSYWEASR